MTPLTKFRKLIKPFYYVLGEDVVKEIEKIIVRTFRDAKKEEKDALKAIVEDSYAEECGTYDFDYIAQKVLERVNNKIKT